ncbi:MAG: DUF481 domain-containing protein [Candidatus Omnitrophica bacterium]|nr:DUF481 domain-containing protein [Candidatus Omnitrophota bacterium]
MSSLFRYSIIKIILINIFVFSFSISAFAEQVFLKNGDRISGEIIEDDTGAIKINSEATGVISIERSFVERILKDEKAKETDLAGEVPKAWERKISLGFNKSGGNTQQSQLAFSLFANRKSEFNEFTVGAEAFYSSSENKMDTQRSSVFIRYASSFGEELNWYNFYKFEAEHDRFADIDYRLVPSIGLGYWFSDEESFKALSECGLGLEHTKFRIDNKDNDEIIIIPRVFLEKKLVHDSRISQDLLLYPTLDEWSRYRLHSETSFLNPISDSLSIRLSFIDDYNSDPPGNTKKNDFRLISALEYSF